MFRVSKIQIISYRWCDVCKKLFGGVIWQRLNLGNKTLNRIEAIDLYDATVALQITTHDLLGRGWLE